MRRGSSRLLVVEEIAMFVPRPALPGSFIWLLFALGYAGVPLLCACATRAVPQHYADTSAASREASAPVAADVTSALRDEPGAHDAQRLGGEHREPAAPSGHGGHHHGH
jgi:hypothetical protein